MTGNGRDSGETDKDRLIKQLREAVRARDEFVAIAAHELRNPMTPILMRISLLLAAARDPARCRSEVMTPRLEALEHVAQEFIRRATMLLDVSRITTGNLRLAPTEMDFSRIVSRVLNGAELAARMARSPLQANVQQGVTGTWDPLAVEQVVENLLSNAIKFGAGKPVAITLQSEEQMAQLTIRDHGAGIAEEDRVRIFERFERAVAQREHGGFGIGLWLSNQLVTAMGGTIGVESQLGQGTTFTVMLPRSSMKELHMSSV